MKKMLLMSFIIVGIVFISGCSIIRQDIIENTEEQKEIPISGHEIINSEKSDETTLKESNKDNIPSLSESKKSENIKKDIPNDRKLYKNEKLGLQFGYPKNRFIREELTEGNGTIYIENQINKDYNIATYPKDFLMMWIDYRYSSTNIFSNDGQIKNMNELDSIKLILKTNSADIYTYEFAYDLDSERSGVGPYLQAIWQHNNIIFNAETADSDNKDNNEVKVDMFKKILGTVSLF